jgi:hypothetical protein
MITNEEIKLLESAKSSKDWDDACDLIMKAHNGYPSDWYSKVIASGLSRRVFSSFDKSNQPRTIIL